MGACEVGIPADRLLEQGGSRGIVFAVESVHVLEAEVIGRPGIEIFGHLEARQCGLVEGDLDFQGREDLRADVLANPMHSVDRAGKVFCPDNAAVPCVDEFDRHSKIRAGNLHHARQAVQDVEQAADLGYVGVGPPQAERGPARGDEQPSQARQLGDQFVRQGVCNGRI
jgi:hypothetical protein